MILGGFAGIVGALTTRQIHRDFNDRVDVAADQLARGGLVVDLDLAVAHPCVRVDLDALSSPDRAVIRVFTLDGVLRCSTRRAPDIGFPRPGGRVRHGYRVVTREIPVRPVGRAILQYARPLTETERTTDKLRAFLLLGVGGGALLALLAGLTVARRAMRPIAQMTTAAAEIERTRDPSRTLPHPEADDEIAELARTLERMLGALDAARADTESALKRQRAFVADASHELRTPLTNVLANLEMLSQALEGENGEAAQSAMRSAQRMRRLVSDLLLLARADAGRRAPRVPTDLATTLVEAAAELGPVLAGHDLVVDAGRAVVDGVRDDLHRLAVNLIENAARHTPPGTRIEASTGVGDDHAWLRVRDLGPGIAPQLAPRMFDRFVRGAGDRGASSGLGLAIVASVANGHGGTVVLEDVQAGASFLVRLALSRSPTSLPAAV